MSKEITLINIEDISNIRFTFSHCNSEVLIIDRKSTRYKAYFLKNKLQELEHVQKNN